MSKHPLGITQKTRIELIKFIISKASNRFITIEEMINLVINDFFSRKKEKPSKEHVFWMIKSLIDEFGLLVARGKFLDLMGRQITTANIADIYISNPYMTLEKCADEFQRMKNAIGDILN